MARSSFISCYIGFGALTATGVMRALPRCPAGGFVVRLDWYYGAAIVFFGGVAGMGGLLGWPLIWGRGLPLGYNSMKFRNFPYIS